MWGLFELLQPSQPLHALAGLHDEKTQDRIDGLFEHS